MGVDKITKVVVYPVSAGKNNNNNISLEDIQFCNGLKHKINVLFVLILQQHEPLGAPARVNNNDGKAMEIHGRLT